MRLLFIHQNFPGQWLHLATYYRDKVGYEVVAVTQKDNTQPDLVRTLRYDVKAPDIRGVPEAMIRFSNSYARGMGAAEAMMTLRDEGFVPDVVLGHCGWGETLFVKEIWPKTRLLIYGEYFYRSRGYDVNFDPEFRDAEPLGGMPTSAYNATFMLASATADRILTPTFWQRDSFPKSMHGSMKVIHDGIDTDRVKPNPDASVLLGRDKISLRYSDEIITFIARNLEPYRGYHILMRALPEIMLRRPKARVIIIGGDGVSYGRAPSDAVSWKQVFLDEVRDRIDMSRIHFVGRVPHNFLWDVLAIGTCHVYLTYPFVLSWSLLEAMSMGCLVVGSATPPVQEVIKHGSNGLLVDFFDVEALARTVVDALERRHELTGLRRAARRTIVERYDLKSRSMPRLTRMVEKW